MLKYVYFGTPELSKNVLAELSNIYGKPVLVISAKDKPSGRGMHLTPTPVKSWANDNNIPCLTPNKLIEIKEFLENSNIEVGVLFAYGKIIPSWLLDLFKYKIINLHPSLLPLYRGPSPIESPLLNGDSKTGITIMELDSGIDTGDILKQNDFNIAEDTTQNDLFKYIIDTGPVLLKDVLNDLEENKIIKIKQDDTIATLTHKWQKTDAEILPNDDEITKWRKYKAFVSYPGVYFFIDIDGKKVRIKITKANYINGKFVPQNIIPENSKETSYTNFTLKHGL